MKIKPDNTPIGIMIKFHNEFVAIDIPTIFTATYEPNCPPVFAAKFVKV